MNCGPQVTKNRTDLHFC